MLCVEKLKQHVSFETSVNIYQTTRYHISNDNKSVDMRLLDNCYSRRNVAYCSEECQNWSGTSSRMLSSQGYVHISVSTRPTKEKQSRGTNVPLLLNTRLLILFHFIFVLTINFWLQATVISICYWYVPIIDNMLQCLFAHLIGHRFDYSLLAAMTEEFCFCFFFLCQLPNDRLCGLVVREVPGSIPGAARFSEK
jgi:hypothetical protein